MLRYGLSPLKHFPFRDREVPVCSSRCRICGMFRVQYLLMLWVKMQLSQVWNDDFPERNCLYRATGFDQVRDTRTLIYRSVRVPVSVELGSVVTAVSSTSRRHLPEVPIWGGSLLGRSVPSERRFLSRQNSALLIARKPMSNGSCGLLRHTDTPGSSPCNPTVWVASGSWLRSLRRRRRVLVGKGARWLRV